MNWKYSRPFLQLAQDTPDIPFLQFGLTTYPLPDNSIDAVVLLNVLRHIKDDQAAMSQVFRIFTPGGIALTEVPLGPHLFDVYHKLLMHQRRYSCRMFSSLARDANLKILCQSHPGFFSVRDSGGQETKPAISFSRRSRSRPNCRPGYSPDPESPFSKMEHRAGIGFGELDILSSGDSLLDDLHEEGMRRMPPC